MVHAFVDAFDDEEDAFFCLCGGGFDGSCLVSTVEAGDIDLYFPPFKHGSVVEGLRKDVPETLLAMSRNEQGEDET